jgi:hypothetical protein
MSDRGCGLCSHSELQAVEEALAAGTSGRAVARRWGVGRNVVARHRRDGHRGGQPVETEPGLVAEDTRARFEALYAEVMGALDRAEAFGNLSAVIRAQAGARAMLRSSLRRYGHAVRRATPTSPVDKQRAEEQWREAVRTFERAKGRGAVELAALAGYGRPWSRCTRSARRW